MAAVSGVSLPEVDSSNSTAVIRRSSNSGNRCSSSSASAFIRMLLDILKTTQTKKLKTNRQTVVTVNNLRNQIGNSSVRSWK